jgi:hypothetical protein
MIDAFRDTAALAGLIATWLSDPGGSRIRADLDRQMTIQSFVEHCRRTDHTEIVSRLDRHRDILESLLDEVRGLLCTGRPPGAPQIERLVQKARTRALARRHCSQASQTLAELRQLIAFHGLDDEAWSQAISAQYFLVRIAGALGMTQQEDYRNLLNQFLRSFHHQLDGTIVLEKNHILVTPEELNRIVQCMTDEDARDDYYCISERTKAGSIDPALLHSNYFYALTLAISSPPEFRILQDVHQLAIHKLLYGHDGSSIDPHGGWYPYRVPWITARALICLNEANVASRDDESYIGDVSKRALQSLIDRIYKGRYWRSGVGDWVTQWESTALCLEALDRWDYIAQCESAVLPVVGFILGEQDQWLVPSPSFSNEKEANVSLASALMACVLLKLASRWGLGIDPEAVSSYLDYTKQCAQVLVQTKSPSPRQFCTVPQIAYYVIDSLLATVPESKEGPE